MSSSSVEFGEIPPISIGVNENDQSLKKYTRSSTRGYPVSTEPLEQRRLSTDNIREYIPEKEEDFSFQKLRGKALEMERKTIESVMKTPTKCHSGTGFPGNKQSIDDSLKQKEDFSFQALREKALKMEKRSQASEVKHDDSSTRKASNRSQSQKMQGEKMNTCAIIKKRSEPSSPLITKKSDNSTSGKESYTPNRLNEYYKQRINKQEVEATDMSHASVKKLSQWLAENPFENHKKPVVARKGVHIVTKARVFEKDYDVTVIEEVKKQDFPTGKVSECKQRLQNAFKIVEDSEESKSDVSDKAKIFENAFKAKRPSTKERVDTRALYGET